MSITLSDKEQKILAARRLRDRSQEAHGFNAFPGHEAPWSACQYPTCRGDRDLIEQLTDNRGHWERVDAWLVADRKRHAPECNVRKYSAIGGLGCSCGVNATHDR